ncbi:MAG: cupredoxin domain-containing protein [Planctomycetota bacterium]|jgi:heme/copper-type cytochrome/quinol oxidase subunit 2
MAASPSRSDRLFPTLTCCLVLVFLALTACGLSYEPKEPLEGENAEEIGRNMLAGAQPNKLQIALAASEDGWQVRHGRDPEVYDNELYVPFDRNVVLSVTGGTEDVALNIPVFRVRKFVEAGKRTKVFFRTIRVGDFAMEWRPVRGAADRTIAGEVHVVSQAEWDEMFK